MSSRSPSSATILRRLSLRCSRDHGLRQIVSHALVKSYPCHVFIKKRGADAAMAYSLREEPLLLSASDSIDDPKRQGLQCKRVACAVSLAFSTAFVPLPPEPRVGSRASCGAQSRVELEPSRSTIPAAGGAANKNRITRPLFPLTQRVNSPRRAFKKEAKKAVSKSRSPSEGASELRVAVHFVASQQLFKASGVRVPTWTRPACVGARRNRTVRT